MSETNPKSALKLYRLHAHQFDNEQAKMFREMPFKDQLELLFYMALNTNATVRNLHEKVDPSLGPIQGDMPDIKAN